MRNKNIRSMVMKALLLLITFHLSLITSEAKVRFGVTGGFQLTDMSFNHDALDKHNRMGWFVGPTVKFTLPVVGMGVDVAALYDQRDLKADEALIKQKSIVIQGSARYGVGIGELLGVFLKVGPQFSFNIGDDFVHWLTTEEEYKQFSLQETMLSVNMGVGVTFAGHFEADLRYNVPISKTSDFTWNELGDQLWDQTWHHAKSRTNAWSVSITYFF